MRKRSKVAICAIIILVGLAFFELTIAQNFVSETPVSTSPAADYPADANQPPPPQTPVEQGAVTNETPPKQSLPNTEEQPQETNQPREVLALTPQPASSNSSAGQKLVAAAQPMTKLFRRAQYQRKYLNRRVAKKGRIHIRSSIVNRNLPAVNKRQMLKKDRYRIRNPKNHAIGHNDFEYTGLIEGFHGRPWSHQERLKMINFAGKMSLKMYVFAPKNDLKHRIDWRSPYNAQELAQFKELIDTAKSAKVNFAYGISPGLSITYSSDADFKTVADKMRSLYDQGARHFNIMFDDTLNLNYDLNTQDGLNVIDKSAKNNDGTVRYPNLGAAHLEFVNRLQVWLEALDPNIKLFFTPAIYTCATLTPGSPIAHKGAESYLRSVKNINQKVDFFWTGNRIVSEKLLSKDAGHWKTLLGRPPVIWYNYPVNDWVPDHKLQLEPFESLSFDLANYTKGILANGMIEPEASQIPLYTFARYLDNPYVYAPSVADQLARVEILSSLKEVKDIWDSRPEIRAAAGYFIGNKAFLDWLTTAGWMEDARAAIFAPADLYGRPGLEKAKDIWRDRPDLRSTFNNDFDDGRFLNWLKTTGWKVDPRAMPYAPAEVWEKSVS